MVGGSPCQDYSVAGKRAGADGERGGLAWAYIRALDAMQPRFILYENVPVMLLSNRGSDYEQFIRDVEGIGSACRWRILDARHFGVPFLVGERAGDGRAPEAVLAFGDCEGRDPLAGAQAWKAAPRRAGASAPAAVAAQGQALRGRDGGATAEVLDHCAHALRAAGGDGSHAMALVAEPEQRKPRKRKPWTLRSDPRQL